MAPVTGKMKELETKMGEASRTGDQDRLGTLREEFSNLYKEPNFMGFHPYRILS